MYPIYDLPPLPRWHSGPIALLGDAAHATSPSAGQGASLALEDAIALARSVRDRPRLGDALAAYEGMRKTRAERVVRFSRQRGGDKVAAGPVARWLRDLLLPVVLRRIAGSADLRWLYSYRLAWEEPGAPA
jgi:2-polyprenyl-6-methoxyphenol hydroxylase-like FAD-dependent oxidoreductase